jgi:hypothetical protein
LISFSLLLTASTKLIAQGATKIWLDPADMQRYHNYRITANTLMEDTAHLHTINRAQNVEIFQLKRQFSEVNNSAEIWRKSSLNAETALSGSLDINLRLQADLDKMSRQKVRWRKIGIGGIIYFTATIAAGAGYIYFFR